MNKPSRRYRRTKGGKSKGRGKQGKSRFGHYELELTSAYQNHDNVEFDYFGSGKGKKGRKNPRGPDGKPMTCHECGSDEHLIRDCQKRKGGPQALPPPGPRLQTGPKVSGQMGRAYNASDVLGAKEPYFSFGFLEQAPSAPTASSQPSSSSFSSMSGYPSMTFAYSDNESSLSFDNINRQLQDLRGGQKAPKAFPRASTVSYHMAENDSEDEVLIEELEDDNNHALQLATYHSVSSPPGNSFASSSASFPWSTSTLTAPPATPSNFGNSSASSGPRITNLLYPWWAAPSSSASKDDAHTFLVKTKLSGSREGLLVDPGAFDNLVGNVWVERMTALCSHWQMFPKFEQMDMLGVQGVGKASQSTCTRVTMPISMFGMDGEYVAPMVGTADEPSDIPALLGLRSLKKFRSILDVINDKLYFIGPGDVQIILPPGSRTMDLEISPSGHMLLPCSEFGAKSHGCRNLIALKTDKEDSTAA